MIDIERLRALTMGRDLEAAAELRKHAKRLNDVELERLAQQVITHEYLRLIAARAREERCLLYEQHARARPIKIELLRNKIAKLKARIKSFNELFL